MSNHITLETESQTKKGNLIIFLTILIVGTNLRVPLMSVGSLIPTIRESLDLNHALAGSITTIPLLAFALISPLVPRISHRITMEKTLFYSMVILLLGFFIRSYLGASGLFLGTIIIGVAISAGNVLIPGFIKLNFPLKVGFITGLYSVAMNATGALGSGVSVPLSTIGGMGWRGSLAFWAILPVIALIFLWIQMKKGLAKEEPQDLRTADASQTKEIPIWKSPLAWSVTFFMGLQSLILYTVVTWLPDLLLNHDYSASQAGWMLFLLQISLFPTTFIVPLIAEKMKSQRLLGAFGPVLFILGLLGLLVGKGFIIVLSVILIGLASGTTFSLSMMFFSLRTKSAKQAAAISGMSQAIGYLLAAIGPVLFGGLYDLTNAWVLPMSMLLTAAFMLLIAGVQSGRDRVILTERSVQ